MCCFGRLCPGQLPGQGKAGAGRVGVTLGPPVGALSVRPAETATIPRAMIESLAAFLSAVMCVGPPVLSSTCMGINLRALCQRKCFRYVVRVV